MVFFVKANEIKVQICFSLMKNNENRFKFNTSLNFMSNDIKRRRSMSDFKKTHKKGAFDFNNYLPNDQNGN